MKCAYEEQGREGLRQHRAKSNFESQMKQYLYIPTSINSVHHLVLIKGQRQVENERDFSH